MNTTMKNIHIYGLSALMAFAFVACDNYEEPNPPAQSNTQSTVVKPDDVKFTSDIAADKSYSLNEYNANGQNIPVATLAGPDLGDYYAYKVVGEISSDGFTTFAKVPTIVEPANDERTLYTVSVVPANMQAAYTEAITKDPDTKKIQIRYAVYTSSQGAAGSQDAQVGDSFIGPFDITLKPYDPAHVIEPAYYLVGTASDFEVAQAIKLNHEGNQYDNPVFSYVFDVTPGWTWKLVPESTFATGNYVEAAGSEFGPAIPDDDSRAGDLVASTLVDGKYTEANFGVLGETGPYMLTVNMETLTFEFTFSVANLYTPGDSTKWTQTDSQRLFTNDYTTYLGMAHLSGSFKFTAKPNWDGPNYGAGAEEGTLSNDGGAGNLSVPANGLYWCNVNLAELKYTTTAITAVGLIGDATPNGWGASTNLTPSADFLKWTGTVKMAGAGEYKIRCNDAWDIDFGGDPQDLDFKGGNIATPGEGTYDVTVDFSILPYTITFSKK